jgi:hypothetical protein
MSITVQIPTALRRLTDGVGRVDCAAANLGELFTVLDQKPCEAAPARQGPSPPLPDIVNEEDIRFLGG